MFKTKDSCDARMQPTLASGSLTSARIPWHALSCTFIQVRTHTHTHTNDNSKKKSLAIVIIITENDLEPGESIEREYIFKEYGKNAYSAIAWWQDTTTHIGERL